MYIEILLVGIITFFVLIYNGAISTSKFFGENKGMFELLQEKDYEFLLRAKYGERVYDVSQVFRNISSCLRFLILEYFMLLLKVFRYIKYSNLIIRFINISLIISL